MTSYKPSFQGYSVFKKKNYQENSKCKLLLILIIGLKAFKGNRFPKDTIYTNLMLFLAYRGVFAMHVNV